MSAYTSVVWTTGDYLTEAKLDNMVANDRAEDAHEDGIHMANAKKVEFRDNANALDAAIYEDANNVLQFVQGDGGFAGLDFNLAAQRRGAMPAQADVMQFPPATRDFTIKEVIAQIMADGTPPADGDMIFNIKLNGTSIWNSTPANRVEILEDATYGVSTDFDTTAVSKYDRFSADCDQTDASAQHVMIVIVGE